MLKADMRRVQPGVFEFGFMSATSDYALRCWKDTVPFERQQSFLAE